MKRIKEKLLWKGEPAVIISEKDYEVLLEETNILHCLYAGGVDNWEWYEDALSEMLDK